MNRCDMNVVKTEDNLRMRVIRLVKEDSRYRGEKEQSDFYENPSITYYKKTINTPMTSMYEFLDYICDALPTGELYLFGGVLRDLAMFGRKGFASDFDLVVEGDWTHLTKYLERMGASRNRFGGYRLYVGRWPIDIWEARETWAIRTGLIQYRGIESLTKTTILNWDAILFNWRTREMIYHPNYFSEIHKHLMDVVLTENPNPLGAAVRAFRHLCSKNAEELTVAAARYLGSAAKCHSSESIARTEIANYRRQMIDPMILRFFEQLDTTSSSVIRRQFNETMRCQFPRLLQKSAECCCDEGASVQSGGSLTRLTLAL